MGKENALGYDPLSRTRSPNENRKSPLLDAPVAANPQGDRNAQQTNAPGPFRRPEPHTTNKEAPADVPRAPQAPIRMAGNVEPAAAQKPKVVIGRLYEKLTPEREKPATPHRVEDTRQDVRPMTETKAVPTTAHDKTIPSSPDRMAGTLETPAAKPRTSSGRLYEKSSQMGEGTPQETRHSTESVFPETTYAPRSISPMMGRPTPEITRKDNTVSTGKFSNYLIIVYTAIMLILGYIVYRDVSKRISRLESKILAIEKTVNH